MTEFPLSESCVLGLMPEAGIKRLLGDLLPDPARGSGIPRAEIYLRVENTAAFHRRALEGVEKIERNVQDRACTGTRQLCRK